MQFAHVPVATVMMHLDRPSRVSVENGSEDRPGITNEV